MCYYDNITYLMYYCVKPECAWPIDVLGRRVALTPLSQTCVFMFIVC